MGVTVGNVMGITTPEVAVKLRFLTVMKLERGKRGLDSIPPRLLKELAHQVAALGAQLSGELPLGGGILGLQSSKCCVYTQKRGKKRLRQLSAY